MNIFNYMNSAFCIRFAIALIHFLWQGFAIGAFAIIIANIFGKKSSRTRYGIYVVSLLAMILSLVVTYSLIDVQSPKVEQTQYSEIIPTEIDVREPVAVSNPPRIVAPEQTLLTEPRSEAEIVSPPKKVESSKVNFSLDWQSVTPYLISVYLLGVLVMACRLLLGLHGGQRLRKLSEPVTDKAIIDSLSRQAKLVGLKFVPAISFCKRVLVPTVVGVFKPTILLPLSFINGLSVDQIEMLLAHELAHIRRYDPLVNIIQRIIEALLFFHPAVWYISHKIRIERENCCDDIVLQITGKPTEYASCLIDIAQQTLSVISKKHMPIESMNAARNPSKLGNRIRRLLGYSKNEQVRLKHSWIFITLIALALIVPVIITIAGSSNEKDDYLKNVKFKIIDETTNKPLVNTEIDIYKFSFVLEFVKGPSPYKRSNSDLYITTLTTNSNGIFSLDLSSLDVMDFVIQSKGYFIPNFERSSDILHTKSKDHIRIVQFETGTTRVKNNLIYNLQNKTVKTISISDERLIEKSFEEIVLVAKRTQSEGNLRLVDKETSEVLFDINDIVRFDWDKQIFELTRSAAMDFMTKQPSRLDSAFDLKIGEEIIYSGSLVKVTSSKTYPHPTIWFPQSRGGLNLPLFAIEPRFSGYTNVKDNRFSISLRNVLQQVNMLSVIDVNNPPPPIKKVSYEWFDEANRLRAGIVVFPETFRLHRSARVHISLSGEKNPDENLVVDVNATLLSNDGKGKFSIQKVFAYKNSVNNIYILEMNPWAETQYSSDRIKSGSAKLNLEIVTRKVINEQTKTYSEPIDRIESDVIDVQIKTGRPILPEMANQTAIRFQKVLKESNWSEALKYCSAKIKSKASEYNSIETFFKDVLPIDEITTMSEFQVSFITAHNGTECYGCEIRFKNTDYKSWFNWDLSFFKEDSKWVIEFPIKHLDIWMKHEILKSDVANNRLKIDSKKSREGFDVRLVPLTEHFAIGNPMLFRVEMKNISDETLGYRNTSFMVNDPLTIKDSNDTIMPYIDSSYQTMAGHEFVEPGDTVILSEIYDASSQYHIIKPGKYFFQFKAASDLGPSDVIEINIAEGDISNEDLVLQKLIEIAPKDWEITKSRIRDDGVLISMIGDYGRKATSQGSTGVLLYINPSHNYLESIDSKAEFLGQTKWGDIYLNSLNAETLWPDYKARIAQALEIEIEEITTEHNGEESQWGEAVDGLQVRLQAEKLVWKADETIQLLLDFHNAGKDDIMIAAIPQQCEVEYDGQWFKWTGSNYTEIWSFPLKPGEKSLNEMQISIPESWSSKDTDKPLKLTPGKHTIRVNFKPMVPRFYKTDPEPSPAISNSLEVEIFTVDENNEQINEQSKLELKIAVPNNVIEEREISKIIHAIEVLAAKGFPEGRDQGDYKWYEIDASLSGRKDDIVIHNYQGGEKLYTLLYNTEPYVIPTETNLSFKKVSVVKGIMRGSFDIETEFDGKFSDLIYQFTDKNIGKNVAIVIDDKVVNVQEVMAPIKNIGVISGQMTQQEAENLAGILRKGIRATNTKESGNSEVEGQVLDPNGAPVQNDMVNLQVFVGGDVNDIDKNYRSYQTTTDSNGAFLFENVEPGSAHIGRLFRLEDQTAGLPSAGVPFGLNHSFEIENNEIINITLGGKGRPVTGRLIPASRITGQIDWSKADVDLDLEAAPFSSNFWEFNLNLRRAMIELEGGDFYHRDPVIINPDGTFRIENVRAGRYMFRVIVPEYAIGRINLIYNFTVDLIPNGTSEEPLNLGDLKVELPVETDSIIEYSKLREIIRERYFMRLAALENSRGTAKMEIEITKEWSSMERGTKKAQWTTQWFKKGQNHRYDITFEPEDEQFDGRALVTTGSIRAIVYPDRRECYNIDDGRVVIDKLTRVAGNPLGQTVGFEIEKLYQFVGASDIPDSLDQMEKAGIEPFITQERLGENNCIKIVFDSENAQGGNIRRKRTELWLAPEQGYSLIKGRFLSNSDTIGEELRLVESYDASYEESEEIAGVWLLKALSIGYYRIPDSEGPAGEELKVKFSNVTVNADISDQVLTLKGLGVPDDTRIYDSRSGEVLGTYYQGKMHEDSESEKKENPVWITFLPNSPIRSMNDYRQSHRITPGPVAPLYKPVEFPVCDFEIRRASDQKRIARIPYKDNFSSFGLSEQALRRIGNLPDDDYIAAFCIGDRRCSNVAQFTIDSDFDSSTYPTLSVIPLGLAPEDDLVTFGIRAIGPTPQDMELQNDSISFPKLVVDDIERQLTTIKWVGPVGPLESGKVYTRIHTFENYSPAIAIKMKHRLKAIVGKYESEEVVVPADNQLSRAWDKATINLASLPLPQVVLKGQVLGADGKTDRDYEVHLVAKNTKRYSEYTDEKGNYNFVNIPSGQYQLICNPKGRGQPGLTIENITIDSIKTIILHPCLDRAYNFTGKIVYEDGKPAVGMDISLTSAKTETMSEFSDFTTTDANGNYTLGGPFNNVTYIGINGTRIRSEIPRIKFGKNQLNFVLRKNNSGMYEAFTVEQKTKNKKITSEIIAEDEIKYIEIDGQKKEANWNLRVVTNDNPDPNYAYVQQWFLQKPDQEEVLLGNYLAAMSHVHSIKASEDGRYLAVVSSGEGAYILQVIDLPLLLEQKEYEVLRRISPFPGGVSIDKWDGDKLIINSGALLTHRNKDGRVLSSSLGMMESQKYALTIVDGHIEPLSEGAKNPVAYFISKLSDDYDGERANAASALKELNDESALPALKQALEIETNEAVKQDIQMAIDSFNYIIVPGERVGLIDKDTSEMDLKRIYGEHNVASADVPIGEGEYEPGTVLFGNDQTRKLEILWLDAENKSKPKEIYISGTKSKWQISNGITLGTTLKELETLNKRSFVLQGSGEDNSVIVIDWKKGGLKQKLGDFRMNKKPPLILKIQPGYPDSVSKEYAYIQSTLFLSTHPIIQKLNPPVYQMIFSLINVSLQSKDNSNEENGELISEISWGKQNMGLRCSGIPEVNEIEQGMNLKAEVRIQSLPEHLEKGVKQLNIHLHNDFLTLLLTNINTGKTYSVYTYDQSSGMPMFDDGITIAWLDKNTLETWKVVFPLITQRDEIEPGLYRCKIEYSIPNGPSRWWREEHNGSWSDYGFWSGTIESQSFELKITEEIPKTAKVLLPDKLHYDKEKRQISYSKDEAKEVELPIRNGCFPGMDIYFQRDGEFVMSGGQSGFPEPGHSIDNSLDPPADGKFIYKIVIFETTEPPIHMWGPESGDYKVLWEKTFQFEIQKQD